MLHRIKSAIAAFRGANLPLREWEGMLTTLDIGEESSAGVRVTEASATRQATVFSCINILARDKSALPLKMYERQADGGRKEVTDHPVAQWLRRPNSFQTPMVWRMRGWYSALATGNQYEQIIRNNFGEIETIPIDSRFVERVELGPDLRKRYILRMPDGKAKVLDADQVFHNFGLSIDGGVTGVSPVRMCMETIGRAIAVNEYGGAYFRSPIPKVIAKSAGKIDPTAKDKFESDWSEKFSGKHGLKTIALMPKGIEIDQIVKIPNNEAQFIETQKFSKEEIAQIYGMPLHRLQALDRATFSNIEHQGLEYVQYTLLPWLTLQEQAIERAFLTAEEQLRYFVRHNVDALQRGDFKTRMEGYSAAINAGILIPNEARAKENMPSADGGDDLLIQGAMVKLKDIQPPQPPQQPPGENGQDEDEPGDDERQYALNRAAGIGAAELRGAQSRRSSIKNAIPDVEAALQREIEIQGREIRRDGVPLLRAEQRDAPSFILWLEQYVGIREDQVRSAVEPLFALTAEEIAAQASREIGAEALPQQRISEFVSGWATYFAAAFTAATIRQLQSVAIEAQTTLDEDPVEAVNQRTEEWEQGAYGKPRAGKEADRETFKLGNAVASLVFTSSGYGLVWATFGSSCPLCSAMRGKRIRGSEQFLQPGSFNPEGAPRPIKIKRGIKHPPLHAGCDCMTVPG